MSKISKRLLHGFCGLIVGFFLGIFLLEDYENLLWCGIAGAIIAGLLVFFMLDKFWEELREYFSWR